MSHPVAIVNCSVTLSDGDVPSGVVLIHGSRITAAGPDYTVSLPAETRLIDGEQGRVSSGGMSGDNGPIFPGQRADLVCHTRFGEVAWVLQAGLVVHPPDAALANWQSRRVAAIDEVAAFLQQRPESRHLQRTADIPGYQKRGIDLLWWFQAAAGSVQSLSIRVVPALDFSPRTLIILDGPSARKLPAAGLSTTRAHWWFYMHEADDAVYCLPVAAMKRWLDVHAKEIPPIPVRAAGIADGLRGRAVPVERLTADLDRMRVIRFK
jgi:hypothetical protein